MEDNVISYSESMDGYLILEGDTYKILIDGAVLYESKSYKYISGIFNSMNPNVVCTMKLKAERKALISKLNDIYSKDSISMADIQEINKIEVKLQSIKFNFL